MNLKNKTYLITGGAGFIGSNLVKKLLSIQSKVVIIDNFNSYYDPLIKRKNIKPFLNNKNFTLIEGNILDDEKLSLCFNNKINGVIHLAARAGVRNSIKQPKEYYQTNVIGTLKILEHIKKLPNPHLIYASSSSVYGDTSLKPFEENADTSNQISPYASSKKAGEGLCKTYANLYSIKTTILRFFTAYGPNGRPDMAPYIFTKAAIQNKPITKFGTGESFRDYTYIDDIVDGIILSLKNKFDYEIFNLGSNKPISLNNFIKTIEKVSNKKLKINKKPLPAGDVNATYASIDKAKRILKWEPKTSIYDGLSHLYKWMNV